MTRAELIEIIKENDITHIPDVHEYTEGELRGLVQKIISTKKVKLWEEITFGKELFLQKK